MAGDDQCNETKFNRIYDKAGEDLLYATRHNRKRWLDNIRDDCTVLGLDLPASERHEILANDRSVWTLELCCVHSGMSARGMATVSPSLGH